jgi:hypothetical protein
MCPLSRSHTAAPRELVATSCYPCASCSLSPLRVSFGVRAANNEYFTLLTIVAFAAVVPLCSALPPGSCCLGASGSPVSGYAGTVAAFTVPVLLLMPPGVNSPAEEQRLAVARFEQTILGILIWLAVELALPKLACTSARAVRSH